MSRARAVFMDRDGTLIEDRHYLKAPEEVVLIPGAGAASARLAHAGYRLILVTNQSGVGRGYFTMEDVHRVHEHLKGLLEPEGAWFDSIYVAPETADMPQQGRKPSPRFLLDAQQEFDLDLSRSYIIGDKLADLECGLNAGVRRSLLVRTGYGKETEAQLNWPHPHYEVFDNFPKAADWILQQR